MTGKTNLGPPAPFENAYFLERALKAAARQKQGHILVSGAKPDNGQGLPLPYIHDIPSQPATRQLPLRLRVRMGSLQVRVRTGLLSLHTRLWTSPTWLGTLRQLRLTGTHPASHGRDRLCPPHLVHVMIQEVGVDVEIKRVLWVKARPDYEPLFSILDGLRHDADRRFWIERFVTPEDNYDVEEDTGQVSTNVKISFPMSHNV